jgi:hypothetical protein
LGGNLLYDSVDLELEVDWSRASKGENEIRYEVCSANIHLGYLRQTQKLFEFFFDDTCLSQMLSFGLMDTFLVMMIKSFSTSKTL